MPSRRTNPHPDLARLLDTRWAVPVLAELHRGSVGVSGLAGGGAKFVTLAARLSISRDALSRTLATLIASGWVERNPGYGHPIRPEYLLAPRGLALARACDGLLRSIDALGDGARDALLRKWPLSVAMALAGGSTRFSDLKQALPGVTPRSLALALKQMESAGLINRRVVEEQYPPRPTYTLPRALRPVLRDAARVQHALAA
ncbi:MAG TPA: transcriptional regulator [Phycisphaerales bacterium]|nr:transcriptional regulator [Phycisphaerales bacterium]